METLLHAARVGTGFSCALRHKGQVGVVSRPVHQPASPGGGVLCPETMELARWGEAGDTPARGRAPPLSSQERQAAGGRDPDGSGRGRGV